MVPQWKRWIGAAAVLLLVGAGCEANVRQDANVETGTSGETQDEGGAKIDIDASSSVDAEIDATVDAALKEEDADSKEALDENSDADVLNNDSAELNAYGQTYVESEVR